QREVLKKDSLISLTGALRRCCEIVDEIEILIAVSKKDLMACLNESPLFTQIEDRDDSLECIHQSGIKILIYLCTDDDFYARLLETTGSTTHLKQLRNKLATEIPSLGSEEAIYKQAGLSYIPP